MSGDQDRSKPPGRGEVSARAFCDAETFAELRRYTIEAAGPHDAPAILYRVGFDRGWADGSRVAEDFRDPEEAAAHIVGPGLPILFLPTEGCFPEDFGGSLVGSIEAYLHLEREAHAAAPVCHLTAGYASGWYSALLREAVLVIEEQCEGTGPPRCRFRGRPLRAWLDAADPRAIELSRYLEPIDPSTSDGEEEKEGSGMMGGFDPLSPAVHVWGAVMVLPYGGVSDADAALETVQADLGEDSVRVVVVDVTGVRLDEVDAYGVMELLTRLESQGLDVVLAGIDPQSKSLAQAGPDAGDRPLIVRDVTEGIARAFQIAYSSEGTH